MAVPATISGYISPLSKIDPAVEVAVTNPEVKIPARYRLPSFSNETEPLPEVMNESSVIRKYLLLFPAPVSAVIEMSPVRDRISAPKLIIKSSGVSIIIAPSTVETSVNGSVTFTPYFQLLPVPPVPSISIEPAFTPTPVVVTMELKIFTPILLSPLAAPP